MEKKYSISELRALANELKKKTHGEGYESFHELQEAPALLLSLRASNANIESILLDHRFRSMEWEPDVREVLRFIMKNRHPNS